MSRKYEATVVIDAKGKDDSIENILNQISKDFEANGAKLEQVDNLGKKKFMTAPRNVEGGFYIHFLFTGAVTCIEAIKSKLKLNENVYLTHFQSR
jgi:small subunit ribosomal protein S6